MLQGVFFFSCIWSLGGTLNYSSREQFSILFHGLLQKEFPEKLKEKFRLPDHLVYPPLKPYIYTIPEQATVFDYRFIKEVRMFIIERTTD